VNVFSLNEFQLLLFFASLVRISCLLVVMPIFGDNVIPPTVKILFSFSLALILFPMVQAQPSMLAANAFDSTIGIMIIVCKEAIVGLIVGFVAKMFFEALAFGFSYMGMQMGFNMATSYDPHHESTTPVISQFVLILSTLIFLSLDSHHLLLKAVAETFRVVPVGMGMASRAVVGYIMSVAVDVFWIAVKLSAPMAAVIFLLNVSFGIVAKAVPQINVMVVSFAVNILIGLLVLLLTMPVLGVNLADIFQEMFVRVFGVMGYLNG
jgi:flagellar biosynthesis protein FliR